MDSPFPGMDPYLEQHWRSVHHRLITYAGDQLQSILPHQFRVEVQERVFLAGELDEKRTICPDVYVRERPRSSNSASPAISTAIAEPIVIELADDPVIEAYLEIVDTASGHRVVTAIEFLGPADKKPGTGLDLYLEKQQKYRMAGVSQVEIDLTRQGERGRALPVLRIPKAKRTLFLACVRRGWMPSRLEAYPMPLQAPLPAIGVPLGPALPDVPLDLQSLVALCYRNGRYDDIDYRADPHPPLPTEDATWAEELLRAKGLRAVGRG